MVRFESTDSLMLARQLPNKTVALILAGGRGSRLKDLTATRAKPAVHLVANSASLILRSPTA